MTRGILLLLIILPLSARPPEDPRCENNRQRLAELRNQYDEIVKTVSLGGLTPEAARKWTQEQLTTYKAHLARARVGRVDPYDQSRANRKVTVGEFGVDWLPAFEDDFPAYYSAILVQLNKEAVLLDRMDALVREMATRSDRLKELGCGTPGAPAVEPLPSDVDTPKRGSAGVGLKSTVTTKPSLQTGGWAYSYGATASKMTYTSTTGTVSVGVSFEGIPAVLTPGSEFTVTITGSFSSNPKGTGENVNVTVWLESSGLEVVSQKPGSMSPRGVFDGKYVFRVPAGLQSADLRLVGDLGFGETAVHHFSR